MENFKVLKGGTKLSGLVSEEENPGPRQCDNCIFYESDHCHHPVVMVDPDVLGKCGEPKPVGDKWCCDNFLPPKRTLVYAVRHGEDENDDLIGGWEDVPIDSKGVQDAKEAANYLKGKGIRMIYSSDMKRTMETAKIIAKEIGIDPKCIVYDFRLRTFNKGHLNGKEKTEEHKEELAFYKDNPHLVIPKGESYDQFADRHDEAFDYYLDEARKEGVKLMLLHNSGIKQLQRYCNNLPTTDRPDSVEPGGIMKVTENKGKLSSEVVLKDSKKGPNDPQRK